MENKESPKKLSKAQKYFAKVATNIDNQELPLLNNGYSANNN